MSGNNVSTDQEFEKIKNAALEEAHEFLDKIPSWFNRNGDYIGRAKAFLDNIETANDIVGLSVCMQSFENFTKDFVNKEFSRLPVKAANTVANYVATDTVTGAIIGVAAAATGVVAATFAAGPVGAAVTGIVAGVCGVAKVYSNVKNKEKEEINLTLEKVKQTRKDIIEYDKKMQMKRKKEKGNDKVKENNKVKENVNENEKQNTQNRNLQSSQKEGNTTINVIIKSKPYKHKKRKQDTMETKDTQNLALNSENTEKDIVKNEQTQIKNVKIQLKDESNIEMVNERQTIHEPTEPRNNVAPRRIHEPTEIRENIAPRRINRLGNSKNEQEMTDKEIITEDKNQQNKPLLKKKDEEKIQQNKPFKRIYDKNKKQETNQNLKQENSV